jgi:hypothetical protein
MGQLAITTGTEDRARDFHQPAQPQERRKAQPCVCCGAMENHRASTTHRRRIKHASTTHQPRIKQRPTKALA